ncbi:MAG: fumarate hydratase, partial [Clostridia bacterium]|nr:fumarate hydratase [Clostridia bacterium]
MREISVRLIAEAVEKLCVKANKILPADLTGIINTCKGCERNALAKDILSDLEKNLDAAKALDIPICQDTGMAVVFLEIGQDVHFVDGSLYDAVNEGVHNGYVNGFLRC